LRIVAQRVSSARVSADNQIIGEIGAGLCLLIGVAPGDTARDARWLAEKTANLRIFSDEDGKMNRSLLDTGGAVLAISQFTLYADCRRGRRPSFTGAAAPEIGEELYLRFAEELRSMNITVKTGKFGAEMKVELAGEGPVTIIIDSDMKHYDARER